MSQKKKGEKKNNLQNEIEAYFKENKILVEMSSEKNEEINKIKKEIEEKNKKAKNFTSEEIFNMIVLSLKESLDVQKEITESYLKLENCKDNTKNYYENSKKLDKDYEELDKYNSSLMKKIKEIKDDKDKLIK